MGYYTRYTLTTEPEFLDVEVPLETLVTEAYLLAPLERRRMVPKTLDMVEEATRLVEEGGYGNPFQEPNKWYGNVKDMRTISRRFPGVLFALKGEGEDPEDQWIKYFKDGKMQVCMAVISYPDYDVAKLE